MNALLAPTFLLLLSFPVAALDDFNPKRLDIGKVVTPLIESHPSDRGIMYVNMIFGKINNDLLFDSASLGVVIRALTKMKDRKFEKKFGVERHYRHWLLINLREMKNYCESRDRDVENLALKMNDSGHMIAGALNNTNNHQLLYLICFLSRDPGQNLVQMKNGRWITAGQLMVVMQFEQNQRNKEMVTD